jgi:2-dehydropantoate 2-reductase
MLETIVAELARARMEATMAPDIFTALWEKAAFNAAINTITAVCHTPCGPVGQIEEGRALAFNIARETVMVAKAWGVQASEKTVIDNLCLSFEAQKNHVPSMGQDIFSKRRTEIDSINGQIIKKAREKGLAVPYTETLYALIRIIEESY